MMLSPIKYYATFDTAIEAVGNYLRDHHHVVHPDQWQSTNVAGNPLAKMAEVLNVSFTVPINGMTQEELRNEIKPNWPWAEDHFQERVSGYPLNPGEQWKNWPWAKSADEHREDGKFSHTYMERYWPREAGYPDNAKEEQVGIRYRYGDLKDVYEHLRAHPLTRQAYLPVWFPEDTGVHHGERVPCTLGYHYILRNGKFHSTYYIRSCDFYRHFRDDLYLSARLQQFMLGCAKSSPCPEAWKDVTCGDFTFHCVSMHCFRADFQKLFKRDI